MEHSKFSPSAAHRWSKCPGSLLAEERYPDKTNIYAEEGIKAHSVASLCLSLGADVIDVANLLPGEKAEDLVSRCKSLGLDNVEDLSYVSPTMSKYVQEYLDYVSIYIDDKSIVCIEQKVSFGSFVPGGFGTVDAAILSTSTGTCDIFDFKYGMTPVISDRNKQLRLYALGMICEYDFMDLIEYIQVHIFQPRIKNTLSTTYSREDILRFATSISIAAQKAGGRDPVRTPGATQCQWCKAKESCKELRSYVQNTLKIDFSNFDEPELESLSYIDKEIIFNNKPLIKNFITSIENSIADRLDQGGKFEGYKKVVQRSYTKWIKDAAVRLENVLGKRAYRKNLISVNKAIKIFQPLIIINKEEGTEWDNIIESEDARNDLESLYVETKSKVPLIKTSSYEKEPLIEVMHYRTMDVTDGEKKEVLDNKKNIVLFLDKVEAYIIKELQEQVDGDVVHYESYRLGNPRVTKYWTKEGREALPSLLGEDAYSEKLITITEAKKIIKDKPMMDSLTYTLPTKTTLVPDSDLRDNVNLDFISDDIL